MLFYYTISLSQIYLYLELCQNSVFTFYIISRTEISQCMINIIPINALKSILCQILSKINKKKYLFTDFFLEILFPINIKCKYIFKYIFARVYFTAL